jgi:hypothetical protein
LSIPNFSLTEDIFLTNRHGKYQFVLIKKIIVAVPKDKKRLEKNYKMAQRGTPIQEKGVAQPLPEDRE